MFYVNLNTFIVLLLIKKEPIFYFLCSKKSIHVPWVPLSQDQLHMWLEMRIARSQNNFTWGKFKCKYLANWDQNFASEIYFLKLCFNIRQNQEHIRFRQRVPWKSPRYWITPWMPAKWRQGHSLTTCNTWKIQNGRSHQLWINKFFDPSTSSMRKVDNGEKEKKKKEKEKGKWYCLGTV